MWMGKAYLIKQQKIKLNLKPSAFPRELFMNLFDRSQQNFVQALRIIPAENLVIHRQQHLLDKSNF